MVWYYRPYINVLYYNSPTPNGTVTILPPVAGIRTVGGASDDGTTMGPRRRWMDFSMGSTGMYPWDLRGLENGISWDFI